MSSKLSTAKIKELMKSWLAEDQTIKKNWVINEANPSDKQKLIDIWRNQNNWKRFEKCRLEHQYFTEYNYTTNQREPYFDLDDSGWCNKDLIAKFAKDDKLAAKCWRRCFAPAKEFDNNYRLEVFTTPEDDEVIGWTIYVD